MAKCKSCLVLGGVIITAVIIIFVILPTIKDIKKINQDIYKERVNLEKLYLRGQSLKKSREDYEKIKEEIKILNDVFYHQGEELKFITSLEQIANQHNIKQVINIKEVKKENEEPEANYAAMRIELQLTGTFPNIISYLDKVQNMDSYFNIDYLKLYTSTSGQFREVTNFGSESKNYTKSSVSQNISAALSGLTYWK